MTTAPSVAAPPGPSTPAPADGLRPGRDLTGLLLVSCGPAAALGAGAFAQAAGLVSPPRPVTHGMFLLALASAGLWLGLLVVEHRAWRWERVAGVLALLGAAVVGRVLYALLGPGLHLAVEAVASAVLLGWLTLELCTRHGLILAEEPGAKPSRKESTREVWIGVGVFLAAGAAVAARAPLTVVLDHVAPWLLIPPADPVVVTPADRIGQLGVYVFTSVVEELIMVAAVVLLGRAAGWRLGTVITLSLALRVVTHLHIGALALTMVVLGAAGLVLFLRHRRVLPMVLAHFLFNAMVLSLAAWGLP